MTRALDTSEPIPCFGCCALQAISRAIVMCFERSRALSPLGSGRASDLLLTLLLATTLAAIGPPARAADARDDPAAVQQQPSAESPQGDDNRQPKPDDKPQPSTPPATPDNASAPPPTPNLCDALANAAAANDLPVDFFTRLIWQESRFKWDAISRAGAQGIAQFMPTTARWRGLENPFDPLDAIAKSGELLRGLRREFGNLGLAAAAYNAGSGRVHDWLGGRRPLPRETRAYVQIVTGRSAEEWAKGQTTLVEMPAAEAVPCNLPVTALLASKPDASPPPKAEIIKPWGVEVVGAPTPAKALARYREWQPKYAAIIAGREPHVVIRGIIGEMGAARVRVGEDTRPAATKLCAALRAAGTYCEVLRN